jgi:hypothetical protein
MDATIAYMSSASFKAELQEAIAHRAMLSAAAAKEEEFNAFSRRSYAAHEMQEEMSRVNGEVLVVVSYLSNPEERAKMQGVFNDTMDATLANMSSASFKAELNASTAHPFEQEFVCIERRYAMTEPIRASLKQPEVQAFLAQQQVQVFIRQFTDQARDERRKAQQRACQEHEQQNKNKPSPMGNA